MSSEDTITIIILGDFILATAVNKTMKSTPLCMDETSVKILGYRSY